MIYWIISLFTLSKQQLFQHILSQTQAQEFSFLSVVPLYQNPEFLDILKVLMRHPIPHNQRHRLPTDESLKYQSYWFRFPEQTCFPRKLPWQFNPCPNEITIVKTYSKQMPMLIWYTFNPITIIKIHYFVTKKSFVRTFCCIRVQNTQFSKRGKHEQEAEGVSWDSWICVPWFK